MNDSGFVSFVAVVIAMVMIPMCSVMSGGHACGEMSGETVIAEVVKVGESRYVGSGDGSGQQKFPLVLKGRTSSITLARNPKSDCSKTAPNNWSCKMIVECLSTSCGLLDEGDEGVFNCWSDGRVTSVNVIQCRM